MEVFYLRDDGMRVRGWAYLSHRTIPAQWMVGDVRLDDLNQIPRHEWLLGNHGSEWGASVAAEAERQLRQAVWSWREQFKPTNEQQVELFERLISELAT